MAIRYPVLIFLGLWFYNTNIKAQENNELKPVVSKDLLNIKYINPKDNTLTSNSDNYVITRLSLDMKFKELQPVVNKGMIIENFTRVPLNIYNSTNRVYILKTSDGSMFTVINRMPVSLGKDIANPNNGYGTGIGGFDFNKILYYALHPKAKAQEKRTAYYRTQINQVVYPN
jgi:hypothetical protein